MGRIRELVRKLWQVELADYQAEIIDIIVNKKYPNVIVCAATQVGKSYAVAIGITLLAMLNKKERIAIIAPTYKQAKIIMDYTLNLISQNEYIAEKLNLVLSPRDLERLRSEITKSKLTWKNGSIITILSSDNPDSLIGHSATTVVLDESSAIDDNTYRTRILRMLSAETGHKKLLFEIGNPFQINHFWDTWNSGEYYKIHINWERAVKEGRGNRDYILSLKGRMQENEFSIWYEAKFPSQFEHGLYSLEEYEKALIKNPQVQSQGLKFIGVDCARYGKDSSVICVADIWEGKFRAFEWKWLNKNDTQLLVYEVLEVVKKYPYSIITVDSVGLGAGTFDVLKYKIKDCYAFNSMNEPSDKKFFGNIKSELAYKVKNNLDGRICFVHHDNFKRDILGIKHIQDSKGRFRIIDPDKSPDFYDAFLLAYHSYEKRPMMQPMMQPTAAASIKQSSRELLERAGVFI